MKKKPKTKQASKQSREQLTRLDALYPSRLLILGANTFATLGVKVRNGFEAWARDEGT